MKTRRYDKTQIVKQIMVIVSKVHYQMINFLKALKKLNLLQKC